MMQQVRELAIIRSKKGGGGYHEGSVVALNFLPESYNYLDRMEEALATCQHALVVPERGLGPQHHATLLAMGPAHRRSGDSDASRRPCRCSCSCTSCARKSTAPTTS